MSRALDRINAVAAFKAMVEAATGQCPDYLRVAYPDEWGHVVQCWPCLGLFLDELQLHGRECPECHEPMVLQGRTWYCLACTLEQKALPSNRLVRGPRVAGGLQ